MINAGSLFAMLRPDLPVIAPSILSADFGKLAHEAMEMESLGVRLLHVDVMDGHFVPNITFGPEIVAALRRASALPLDVHLMVQGPERYLKDFVSAGASSLTVHAEACPHLHRVVQEIRLLGASVGVSLNPATSLAVVEEIIRDVDLLLVMTVNPGFGGQTFIDSSMDKLRRAHRLIRDKKSRAVLQADGGVGPANALDVAECGVEILVAGSAFMGAENRPDAFEAITSQARKGLERLRKRESSQ